MKNDSNRQSMGKFINFLDRYDIINFSKNYRTIIFLSILLLLGMVLGTISISAVNMDFIYKVDFLFLNDFKERIASSNLEIFTSSLLSLSFFFLADRICDSFFFWRAAYSCFNSF